MESPNREYTKSKHQTLLLTPAHLQQHIMVRQLINPTEKKKTWATEQYKAIKTFGKSVFCSYLLFNIESQDNSGQKRLGRCVVQSLAPVRVSCEVRPGC